MISLSRLNCDQFLVSVSSSENISKSMIKFENTSFISLKLDINFLFCFLNNKVPLNREFPFIIINSLNVNNLYKFYKYSEILFIKSIHKYFDFNIIFLIIYFLLIFSFLFKLESIHIHINYNVIILFSYIFI